MARWDCLLQVVDHAEHQFVLPRRNFEHCTARELNTHGMLAGWIPQDLNADELIVGRP